MQGGYHNVMDMIQTLLGLLVEFEPSGLPLQPIQQLILDLMAGPMIHAAKRAYCNPSKSPAYIAEALTVTNNPLDLISRVPPPSFMPNSDASTEAVKPFHSTPVLDLLQSIDEAPSKAATAAASTEAVKHLPSTTTVDLSQSTDKAPSKAANAEASQASRLSIDENRKRWVVSHKDNAYTPETSAQPQQAAIDRSYSSTHAVPGPHQPQLSQHKSTDVSPPTPVVNEVAHLPQLSYHESTDVSQPTPVIKNPIDWKLSKQFETHFNEVCPINLLGDKCKCQLVKVDLKVPSPSLNP